MIASVQRQILQQGDDHLVVLVGGIGLHINVPRTVFDHVEGPGHTIQLATHLDVREDALTLYGFSDEVSAEVVRRMIGENMDPRDPMALSALGEIANVITGNAATELAANGFTCDISPPVIIEPRGSTLTSCHKFGTGCCHRKKSRGRDCFGGWRTDE